MVRRVTERDVSATYFTFKERLRDLLYEPLTIIYRNRKSRAGLFILLIYFFMATVGPRLIRLDLIGNPLEIYEPPSLEHLLGTDYAGRDILAQIVHGSTGVLTISFLAALITIAISTTVGIVSGFRGGISDSILMTITDTVMTIPGLPLMIVFSAYLRTTSPIVVGLILSITAWAALARAIRSQVLSIRENAYIESAKALGLSTFHTVFFEIMPNLMSYIVIGFIFATINALFASVGLYFLGVLPFTAVNWGVMLNMAYTLGGALYSSRTAHYLLAPIIAIMILQIGLIQFSYAVDEIFNPRLRKEYIKKL